MDRCRPYRPLTHRVVLIMFHSSRQRRIDRALSSALQTIDDDHERLRQSTSTWADLDWLSIAMDRQRSRAYDRAAALSSRWQARIAAADDE